MKMKRSFFTIIELVVVIAIIIVLAGIVLGGVKFAQSKAQRDKTIAIMMEFQQALEEYNNDYGHYPIVSVAAEVNFSANDWKLFTNTTRNKRNKPYMEGAVGKLEDAYGEAFFYQYPNSITSRNTTKYALWSKGLDTAHGKRESGSDDGNMANAGEEGSDDICSWKRN